MILIAPPWLLPVPPEAPPCKVNPPPDEPVVVVEPAPAVKVTAAPAVPAVELPVPWIDKAFGAALVTPLPIYTLLYHRWCY